MRSPIRCSTGRCTSRSRRPDLNVPTGDALTPWTLTEEFGPLDPAINEITGSIFSVDPNNRGLRQLVSGPDFLGWIIPPPRGEFHGLGSELGLQSAAFDVSADGRVVSGHNRLGPTAFGPLSTEAFAWSPQTGQVPLGVLPGGSPGRSTGLGVSAEGNYVVGGSTITRDGIQSYEAFRWSLGSGMEDLGTINGVSSTSEAVAASRHGEVVVGTDEFFPPIAAPFPAQLRRAFRYTEETGMEDLGTLPAYGELSTTEGADVSENGRVVVGTAFRGPIFTGSIPLDFAQPFRWTRETGMQGLGTLPRVFPAIFPTPQQETIANAVSADGEVVVGVDRVLWQPPFADAVYPYQDEAAVLWTRDGGWIDLGQFQLPPGPEFLGAEAVDVSGDGDTVIGEALVGSTDALDPVAFLEGDVDGFGRVKVPFIWDESRGMRPLARVLAGDFGLDFDGWVLGEATAISDDGTTIVGTGTNPDGIQEAWRAVMHRNTRPGDADFDGDVDVNDRATLLENLGLASATAEVYYRDGDFDGDGVVGDSDMHVLLSHYDGRSLGDFNADGVVDAADYTLWRDHDGLETGVADSNGDGWANAADLDVWRANYGATVGDLALAVAVPEPAALLLAVIAVAGFRMRRW